MDLLNTRKQNLKVYLIVGILWQKFYCVFEVDCKLCLVPTDNLTKNVDPNMYRFTQITLSVVDRRIENSSFS